MTEPKKYFSGLDEGPGNYMPTRQQAGGYTPAQQAGYIEELKKVNEELKQARRAALNLMEDAIASKEALRISEEKYRTLFDSMDEGYCILQMIYDDAGHAINWRYLQVNKAFEINNGLYNAKGKTILEMAPDIEPKWIEIYNSVAQTGEPLRFEEDSVALNRIFSLYAFRIGNPQDHKVAVIFTDISQRKQAEKALRESEERKAFLLNLTDTIGSINESVKIQEAVTRFAMDHFAADRCYYCEINSGKANIRREALKEGLPSVAGEYSLSEMLSLKNVIDAGHPFVVHDVNTTELVDESLRKTCIQLQIISFIDIPVIKNGEPTGILCIVQSAPREWKDFEVELAKEIAERTSAAVERAKVEEANRENEVHKEFLLKLNDTLRHLEDPLEIQYEASRLVAEQLEADRVHFAEIVTDEQLLIRKDYVRGAAPSLAGTFKPKVIVAALKLDGDEPVVIADTQEFPWFTEDEKALLAAVKIRSQLSVALSRSGKKVAGFSVDQTRPRQWKPLEVSILQEAAERTWSAIERVKAEEALRENQAILAQELVNTKTLQKISGRIVDEGNVNELYDALISSAKELMESDCASIQILNPVTNQLLLVASQGFHPESVEFWKYVDMASGTSSGKALERKSRVVITDVDQVNMATRETLDEYHRSGIVATQSTPLISRSGKCVGMMSTHWKRAYQPSERKLGLFELLTRQVADVIERKQADDALRHNEQMFSALVNNAPFGVYMIDGDFRLRHVSTGCGDVFKGIEPLIGRDFAEILHIVWEEPFATEAINRFRHTLETGESYIEPQLIETRANIEEIQAYDWQIHRISLPGGSYGVVCYFYDLSEQKRLEETVRRSKERLQKAMEIETVGVIFFNDKFEIHDANHAFLQITGYTSEQVSHLTLDDITPPEWKPAMNAAVKQIMADGIATPYERELICADGSRIWGLCAKARINENDNIEYIIDVTKRREAEEALRQNEARFRTLTNAVPQVIWTNDGKGKANFFNDRWYKYSGLNYDESIGIGWEAIVHPDDAPASTKIWHKALAEGTVFDTEYRLRRHDNVYRWHIGRNIPLKSNEGKITGWFGSATEIEQLKQTENALRESEAKMKITLESATDFAIITIDEDCLIESWNSGAEIIFGYKEEEVKGKLWNMIFTPEDIADHVPEKERKRARETGHASDDRWHVRRNGERFFVSGVTSPIYDNNGLIGYVKIARDMTQQRSADENLRIWEERYRIALLSAEMGAWDWNIAEDTLIWNDQQFELLGLKPEREEKSLNDFFRLMVEEDRDRVRHALQNAIETSNIFQMEFRIKRADNDEIRWINKFGLVVTNNGCPATRMIGVMYDITERKKLEQQKEDFIGIASHELKTPVTSVKAYAELLQEMLNQGDYSAGSHLVPKLNKQVDRLIELVHALLDITKMAEGELALNITEFDLKHLIEECTENLQRTTNSSQIIIKGKKEAIVHADRERISQVLTNLISNAGKYSPNGGDITVNWKHTREGTEVSVKDKGMGISKDMQAKVFERFFRVNDDAKAHTFPGMGLGLFITTNIVQRHGGRIWMESELGKGSVFYFLLPDKISKIPKKITL